MGRRGFDVGTLRVEEWREEGGGGLKVPGDRNDSI